MSQEPKRNENNSGKYFGIIQLGPKYHGISSLYSIKQHQRSYHHHHQTIMTSVTKTILTRRSARQFIPDKVPDMKLIREILTTASRAANGGNIQPWKVYVICGEKRNELVQKIVKGRIEGEKMMTEKPLVSVYPAKLEEPYVSRRMGTVKALGAAVGILPTDTEKRSMFELLFTLI
jgi:hypothetical protein